MITKSVAVRMGVRPGGGLGVVWAAGTNAHPDGGSHDRRQPPTATNLL
jgi:hypothetical protein